MQDIDYIKAQLRIDKRLKHASNIIGKYQRNGAKALSDEQKNVLLQIAAKYKTYLETNLDSHGYDDVTIKNRVQSLNSYYDFINDNGWDNYFDSRGKFRSTILEEFIYILFKDYVSELKMTVSQQFQKILEAGAVKAYLNLFITGGNFVSFVESPSMRINTKDQDFAIFRKVKISLDKETKTVNIPCVAIESKTYIDKTMLDTIIATADKLKGGNPYTKFVAVSETYDVDLKVDPAYSRIDQIYVLRKCKPDTNPLPPIDEELVCDLFKEIKRHIDSPWSDVGAKLPSGKIL